MKKLFALAALFCFSAAVIGCGPEKKVETKTKTETSKETPAGETTVTTETTKTKTEEGDGADTTPSTDLDTPADPIDTTKE